MAWLSCLLGRGAVGRATGHDSVLIPECVPELTARVLQSEPRCGRTRLVCIDGPAGSGKTTLAAAVARAVGGAPVVHMDDLYQGWDQPLGAHLAGRVDAWLLTPWEAGLTGKHPRYDWVLGRFGEWVQVPAAPVVILEGCASATTGVRDRASVVIWVEAPVSLRLERGLDRDGDALEAQWRSWQEREAAHFAADGTRAAADLLVDGRTGRLES